jgi:hypothetical protein
LCSLFAVKHLKRLPCSCADTAQWNPETGLRKLHYDGSAVAEKSSRFELAHPFLRVPQYKNVAALKTYLLQRLKLAPEQVGAEIYGVFKNKVTAPDVAACVVVCELYAIDSAS